MSYKFKEVGGPWHELRRNECREIDFHRGRRDPSLPYMEAMSQVWGESLDALRSAYEDGCPYVLIGHGYSTSRPFHVTARSHVRRLMHSPDATPYIDRSRCLQHNACFLAAIRPKVAARP